MSLSSRFVQTLTLTEEHNIFFCTMYVYYEVDGFHEEEMRAADLQRKDFVLFLIATTFYHLRDNKLRVLLLIGWNEDETLTYLNQCGVKNAVHLDFETAMEY
jgi:hypothetical protein